MKRTFYFVVITLTLILGSLSSCTKDIPVPPSLPGTGNYSNSANSTILQANNWVKDANGFYVHTFKGFISPGSTVNVYLLAESNEVQINNYILFMRGQLWASVQDTDLKIFFRYSGQLPFTFLTIKVVFG